jgi:putative thioredoxin
VNASPTTVEVTDATFESLVVEESMSRPVVVDLWADWCQPCKTLGPMLEKVAAHRDGAFLLAKVDVDHTQVGQELLAALRSQSIPTVVAFKDGQPVNGFVGVIGEADIEAFVDSLLPTEVEAAVEEAKVVEAGGDLDSAEAEYREALTKDPKNRDAALGLARILIERGDVAGARELLNPLIPDPEAERLLATVRVRSWADDPKDGAVGEARVLATQGRWREALERMLAAMGTEDRPAAHADMLDAFAALGDEDPLVGEFRRKLASTLF